MLLQSCCSFEMIIQLRHAEPLCKPFAHSLLNFLLGKRDGTSPQLCFPTAASTDRVQCKWNQCPFQLLCLRENRVIVHNPKLSVLIRFVTNGLLPRSDRMYRLLVEPVHQTPPPPSSWKQHQSNCQMGQLYNTRSTASHSPPCQQQEQKHSVIILGL